MSNVSFSKLGTMGNLGNQLFQIASTIGLARLNGMDPVFPEWQYEQFFKGPFPCFANEIHYDFQANEANYHFDKLTFDRAKNVDVVGWLQTEKYWKHCEREIRDIFQWNPVLLDAIKERYAKILRHPFTAVSVRRGDYVDNPNYYQLGAEYYTELMTSECCGEMIVVFSDDFEWCKEQFSKLTHLNIFYAEGLNAIEQLCFGSLASKLIISNSSFAWWMAYLSGSKNVFVPPYWNDGTLLQTSNDKDVLPEAWEDSWYGYACRLEPHPEPIDLSDVTFTIPVKIEHKDRRDNLILNLKYLDKHFKTSVHITEQDSEKKLNVQWSNCYGNLSIKHTFEPITDSFERTRILNDMAHAATTPIVVNWDTDVFIDPSQILEAVTMLREDKADGVYPYDGRFYRCSRNWEKMLFHKMDVSIFKNVEWPDFQTAVPSFGGAIFWNKEKFISGGMENQYMIHYGPEDYERYARFTNLGYRIQRIAGPLYHLDHAVIGNGSLGHKYSDTNVLEFQKVQHMKPEALRAYVSTWPWTKGPWGKVKPAAIDQVCALDALEFDKIWCLTLPQRADRHASACLEFNKIGLEKGQWEFFPATDGIKEGLTHPDVLINPGMRGCFESHKAMLKHAIDAGYDRILITEDDLLFIDDFNTIFGSCVATLPEDWEFIYLGHYENDGGMEFKSMVNSHWVIPNAVWGTHGYAIRGKETIRKIYYALSEQVYQVDIQLCRFLNTSDIKHYASFPPVIFQDFKNLPTDIQVPFEQKLI